MITKSIVYEVIDLKFSSSVLLVGDLKPNYHQVVNILFETMTYYAKVATLNLPHVGKQQNNCRNLNLGLVRLQAKREARESHHMLMGM